jgi:hypothetical protein
LPIIGSAAGIEVGSILFIYPSLTSMLSIKKIYSTAQAFQTPTTGTFAPPKTLNLATTQEQK